ncbi:MAG TPA: type II toxin-antitoxin system VapC family toxin [Solirubrobacterales bacterium]
MPVWDTSVASGLRPEGKLLELAAVAALAGEPIRLAAPTVAEISYGLQRRSEDERFVRALDWFTEILGAGLLEVLPVSREAALVAGRLRALHPMPPSAGGRRAATGSKPERRVAWVADIQIAACAWLQGETLCTADERHFGLLSQGIGELFPQEGGLEVLPPPG